MPPSHQPTRTEMELDSMTVSALAFLLWELCTTFDAEIDYIWSKPHKSPIKWLFILTRYTAIAVLGMNITIFMNGPPPISCKNLLALQMTMVEMMITLVEFILVLRVVALYNGSLRLRIFLSGLVIVGTAMTMITFVATVNDFEFGDFCSVKRTTIETDFGFTFIITEFIILVLTLVKGVRTLRASESRIPLVEVMLRDGILSYLSCIIVAIPGSLLFAVWHGTIAALLEPWFIAVYSCVGCRLVLNMQLVGSIDHRSHALQSLPVITSQIIIDPSPSGHTIHDAH
ncbi:hypothetical protein BJ138DRAFT_1153320, partial [Hygrophoropsis aurantiaca]